MSRPRFIAWLLVLGTLAVYLPAAHHGFTLYDDNDYVTDNPMVENGLTWPGIQWAFTTWHASNWHPLTWLSHMVDCQLAGLNPSVPHCENVLFHVVNAVLLFALLRRLTDAIWPSAFVAALFAWHPLHVESVAWIAERKDVLSTFFALLALLAYTRAVTSDEWRVKRKISFQTLVTRHASRFYWLALLCFALGLMAKPMLVTLPFVMVLLDFWPLQRISGFRFSVFHLKGLLIEKIPFFTLAAVSCVITFMAQHHGGSVVSLEKVPMHYRLENIPVAYAGYLLKMIWPAHLAVLYPLTGDNTRLTVATAFAALILISVAAGCGRERAPYWLTGWLWYLGMLVPVIGLVQVGGAAMADRYTYFPSVGIFLAVALGLRDAASRLRISKLVIGTSAGLVLAACLALTHRQVNFWRDDVTLFSHAIEVTRNNPAAHLNLGYAFEDAGRKSDAMAEYRIALEMQPDRSEVHNNLANLLGDSGHPGEAEAHYQEALRINPRYIAAHNNYGTMLVELGRFDEAMSQYAAAARLDPADWHSPYLAGKALLKRGRDAEAIPYFQRAIAIDPNNPRVLTYLAQVLASDEYAQVRDGHAALELAAKANELTGGVQPAVMEVLAMAYAELGQFTNAQQTATEALKIANAFDLTNEAPLLQQRLQLYQNRQPFRQSFLYTNATKSTGEIIMPGPGTK